MEENIFNTELGKKALALTKASFRVADLIPDLIFREKIKNNILNFYKIFSSSSSGKNHKELIVEIDNLDRLFYLAGHLNFSKEEHVRSLRNGFLVFKSHIVLMGSNIDDSIKNNQITKAESRHDISNNVRNEISGELNQKQKKIMDKFNDKEILKLAEILEVLPDVSERTVRNELASLIGLGKITRSGRGNGSFYRLAK